jgi:hypothetical protein
LDSNFESSEAMSVRLLTSGSSAINKQSIGSVSNNENGDKQVAKADTKPVQSVSLKDLKEVSKCTVGDVEMQSIRSSVNKKWVFDSNGFDYHYHEADKGNVFLVFNYVVKSKNKNPILPVLVAGTVEKDGKVSILGVSDIKFPSWTNYGAYLGNYRDFKNDFAKRDSISFTAAIQVPEEVYKSKKLIVFVPDISCATRYDGDGSPPVFYNAYDCKEKIEALKESINLKNVIKIYGKL